MCKYDDLKETAKPMFRAVCLNLPRNHERGQARETIRAELDKHESVPNDRRFIADWMMAQMGYGGGF